MTVSAAPRLGFGLTFADLSGRDGLIRLDKQFLQTLAAHDPGLHQRLLTARATPDSLTSREESDLVVALGPHLDAFVADLFAIQAETAGLMQETPTASPCCACPSTTGARATGSP